MQPYEGLNIFTPGGTWENPQGDGTSPFCGKGAYGEVDDPTGLVYGVVIKQGVEVGDGYPYFRDGVGSYDCANCGIGSCQYSFNIQCEASSA